MPDATTSPTSGSTGTVDRRSGPGPHPAAGALLLAALGVVFGDIGTSPLYALQTVFSLDRGAVQPDSR